MNNYTAHDVQKFLDDVFKIQKKQLSKREQFAIEAMREFIRSTPGVDKQQLAKEAVKMADEMIKALEK